LPASPRLLSGPQGAFAISFSANIEEVEAALDETQRWVIPYATSTALSRTAYEARKAEQLKLKGVFDRPIGFTVNSVLYKKASVDNLTYIVFIRDEVGKGGTAPAAYLRPSVVGGARRAKPFEILLRRVGVMEPQEFAIPAAGMKRNAYGNLPASLISTILSQLKARRDTLQNTTARSKGRARKASKAEYFVPAEGSRSKLPRGVYQRLPGRKIKAVLIFVGATPRYRKRYDFGQAARAKALRVFGPEWAKAFREQMAKR
jgi:hypothetical protein